MSFSVLLLAAVVSTVLSGFLARWIATFFVAEDIAPVAGFSFVLGGGSLVTINLGVDASDQLSQSAMALGTLLGAAMIWYLFFKREKANG